MSSYKPKMYDNNIMLTRVRLARNVSGEPFRITDKRTADAVISQVYSAASRIEKFKLYRLSVTSPQVKEVLKEKHLISNYLVDNSKYSAALINTDETVSVMIHEEDVLRQQCFMRGFALQEAYKRLSSIDDALSKNIDFAYDEKLGFLTACPTNLGTGLRASVMMFLPALTESGKIKEVIKQITKLGFTVRGVYGEGSKAEGFIYQISNEVTLGVTETQVIEGVEDAVLRICEAERITMKDYYSKNLLVTENQCRRSLALLENSVLLTYDEFLYNISRVRLGISLGFFDFENPQAIDDLTVYARPANLCERYERELSSQGRDYYRADFVKNSFKKIKGNN